MEHRGKGFFQQAEELGYGHRRRIEESFFAFGQISRCLVF